MSTGSAIGIVETSSLAKGYEVADAVMKRADVKMVVNRTICPGKYMVLIGGDVDAVTASIETGIEIGAHTVVDHFVDFPLPQLLKQLMRRLKLRKLN
ncbi:MAG: BMC domain-containing protein [Calditrichaceae bacterium]